MEKRTLRASGPYGPKQIGIILYSAFIFLYGTCIVGGQTNTIIPYISAQTGWNQGLLMTMAGVSTLVALPAMLWGGGLVKRLGAKITIVIGAAILCVFVILYGYAKTLPLFIIAMLLLGFGSGFVSAGNTSMVNNWWPTKKGMILGWATMGVILVDVLWNPYMPVAFAKFGTGLTMVMVAAVVAIITIIAALTTKNYPEQAGEFPDGAPLSEDMADFVQKMSEYQSPYASWKKAFSTRAIWALSGGMGLIYMVAMTVVCSIVPRLLMCGYEYEWAKLVLIVGGICGLIGSVGFGYIDQFIGTQKATIILCIVDFIALAGCLLHKSGPIFVWLSAIFFFAGQGAVCNLIPSYVGTKFGRWDYPFAYRIIGPMTTLGCGLGIMCTGLFAANYNIMYIMDIVLVAIALVIIANTNNKLIGKAG